MDPAFIRKCRLEHFDRRAWRRRDRQQELARPPGEAPEAAGEQLRQISRDRQRLPSRRPSPAALELAAELEQIERVAVCELVKARQLRS